MATDAYCYQPGGQLGRLVCLRSLCACQSTDVLTTRVKESGSRLAALFTLSIVAACGQAPAPLPEWSLADGGAVAPLLNAADTVVLLFHDPGDCFSCSSPVAEWLAWSKGGAARHVEIVLSRRPSAMRITSSRLIEYAESSGLRIPLDFVCGLPLWLR